MRWGAFSVHQHNGARDPPRCVLGGWCACVYVCVGACTETCEHMCVCVCVCVSAVARARRRLYECGVFMFQCASVSLCFVGLSMCSDVILCYCFSV